MKKYLVRKYESKDFAIWNAFVSVAKNATFLFHRDFMEYHQDRFQDFSLLVFEEEKLISIVPANKLGDVLFSHQGLSYGGFVFLEQIKLPEVISIVKNVLQFLSEQNIKTLQLKVLPSIYNRYFSEEIEYVLFLTQAQLTRRDCLSVLDLTKPFKYSTLRKRGVDKGVKNELVVKEEVAFESYWNEILIPNLANKHQVKPVHTLEEIALLQQRFPKNIRHFNVYHKNKLVAGATVFETNLVAHAQYISGNEQKNELGSVDFLFNYLITDVFKDNHYFDFGN